MMTRNTSPNYQRIPDDPVVYQHRLAAIQRVVDRVDRRMGQPRRIVRGEPGQIVVIERADQGVTT